MRAIILTAALAAGVAGTAMAQRPGRAAPDLRVAPAPAATATATTGPSLADIQLKTVELKPGEPPVDIMIAVNGQGAVRWGAHICSTAAGKEGALCQRTVAQGAPTTFTAQPRPGMALVAWAGGCSGKAESCTITPTGKTTLAATFAPAPKDDTSPWATLTISYNPQQVPAIQADIQTVPKLNFECVTEKVLIVSTRKCSALVKRGASVEIRATLIELWPPLGDTVIPPKKYVVTGKGWSGCYSNNDVCTLTMNVDRAVSLGKN